jgi:hypothetical protein
MPLRFPFSIQTKFLFPFLFKKALLDIFKYYHLRGGIYISCARSVLVLLVFNRASTCNLCHIRWPCFIIPGSIRSVLTMLANNQSHVDAIVFPSTISFLNQGILSPIYSVVLFSRSLLNTFESCLVVQGCVL